jgi:thioesterase domain-containing protein/acyl carrier protein
MQQKQEALAAPRNSVERTLAEIWARLLGLQEVGIYDDFFRSGGDSLSAAELVVQIQKVFGRTLPITILLQEPTVEYVARVISRQIDLPTWTTLVELQSQGTNPPFFCVHPVGGEVLCYSNLARNLAPDQPFYGIRAVGSGGAGEAFLHITDMATRYTEEIRAFQPEGPYFLGGYSFGGSVALEIAQQLVAQGQKVALLAILDHTPPPTRYQTPFSRPFFFIEFLWNTPLWLLDELFNSSLHDVMTRSRLKAKTVMRKTKGLLGRRRHGSTVAEVADLFDLSRMPKQFQKVLEVHYPALREYVPNVYTGRVTLFRARTRPLFRLHGYDLGWRELAAGGLEIIVIPGNHNSILNEPYVKVLAARLRACLRKAQRME